MQKELALLHTDIILVCTPNMNPGLATLNKSIIIIPLIDDHITGFFVKNMFKV